MQADGSLGHRLADLRKQRGISQQDMALEAGVSRAHYGRLERDEVSPLLGTLQRIADYYGLSLSELLKGVHVDPGMSFSD